MSEPTDPASTEPGTAGPETPTDVPPARDPLRGSRTSGVWLAVVAAAVLLVLLVVFIVQNTQSVQVAYLGWDGTAPLSAALLIAAAAGMVIVVLVASLRLLQVRRRVRRERH